MAIRNANKEDLAEAKDGVFGPLKRTIKNQKLKETSKGSVKVVKPQSNTTRGNINHNNTIATNRAKSGSAAREGAYGASQYEAIDRAMGNSNSRIVKINSANPTRQGSGPAIPVKNGRRISGLMGRRGAGGGGPMGIPENK
jgi:hypothetical protein